jgi:hypothetical protein
MFPGGQVILANSICFCVQVDLFVHECKGKGASKGRKGKKKEGKDRSWHINWPGRVCGAESVFECGNHSALVILIFFFLLELFFVTLVL